MSSWLQLPFDDVIADESSGNIKTPQGEYLTEGKFAVVDQGKAAIGGYVNDEVRVCRAQLPAIVFGDHTRCLKYVDFPFCMGADGVKVLRPKIDADVKYLFHYLRQLEIPNGGYDRHFKYLKRSHVVVPPIAEQRRIAEVLDRADALRAKRRAALVQLDSLTQSIFLDMFGDPVRNSIGWPNQAFGDICETRLGKMLDKKQQTGAHRRPYLRNANVQWFCVETEDVLEMDFDESARETFRLEVGDLLICEGGEPGRAAIWLGDIDECYYQKALHRARPSHDVADAMYLVHLLWFYVKHGGLRDHVTSATIAHLTGEKLKAMRIPVPPLALQRTFARRVVAVDKLKAAHYAALTELDALFASLQHRAFRGEL